MNPVCRQHPDAEAWYRCQGCGRLLCDDCVDVLSRIAVCRLCGELARPLETDGAGNSGASSGVGPARRGRTGAAPGLVDHLRYPLRDRQGVVLAACTVLLAAPVAAEILLPAASCLLFVPRFLLALLLPGIVSDVARASADGLPGLPEWPRYPGGRTGELVRFVVAGFLALLPGNTLLRWSGCAEEVVASGRLPPLCNLLVAAALWLGAVLWVPLFGAGILRARLGAVLHFPAHGRVLRRHGRELMATGSLAAAPLVLAVVPRTVAPSTPVAGVLEVAFALYGAILGGHLVGRYLLRHREELERRYRW